MPLLQRAYTLSEKRVSDQKPKNVSWKQPKKPFSFWSIPQNDNELEEDCKEQQSLIKCVIKSQKYLASCEATHEFQRKIDENCFTINLLNHQRSSLPQIKSMAKAERLLISHPQFKSFQKSQSDSGHYHSLLHQLQRKQQSYFHRLNIPSKMQIKTRKNVEQSHKKNKSQSLSKPPPKNTSVRLIDIAEFHDDSKKTNPLKKSYLKRTRVTSQKWKLNHFYDPLLIEFQNDSIKTLNLKERNSFIKLSKLIHTKCENTQKQNQSKKYVEIFGRFSEAMDSKLVKKQRKLEKIQNVFKSQNFH